MLDFVLRADREEGGDVVGDGEAMNLEASVNQVAAQAT